MRTTKRFDKAVTKLYNAFNEGRLEAMDCTACVVGNMCDNNIEWKPTIDGSHPTFSSEVTKGEALIQKTGYSVQELRDVENLFMYGNSKGGHFRIWHPSIMTTEEQFNGLMAVINYLAELDGIEVPQVTINKFEEVLV